MENYSTLIDNSDRRTSNADTWIVPAWRLSVHWLRTVNSIYHRNSQL